MEIYSTKTESSHAVITFLQHSAPIEVRNISIYSEIKSPFPI